MKDDLDAILLVQSTTSRGDIEHINLLLNEYSPLRILLYMELASLP